MSLLPICFELSLPFFFFSSAKPYPAPQSGAAVALAAGRDSRGAYAPVGPTLLLRYQLQPKEVSFLLGGKHLVAQSALVAQVID